MTAHRIEHDPWMVNPADPDYLPPERRWCRVCGKDDLEHDETYYGFTDKAAYDAVQRDKAASPWFTR